MPSSPEPTGAPTGALPDPNKVVERLLRDPIGAALWRACIAEEQVELLAERVRQLEQQKSPAAHRSDQS